MIDALERAYDNAGPVIAGLTADQLTRSSPCTGWDAYQVLDHMLGVIRMFTEARAGAPIPESLTPALDGGDPAACFAATVKASLAAWRESGTLQAECGTPLGVFPGHVAVSLDCLETVVHSWDLAKATGQHYPFDAELASHLLEFARTLPLADIRASGEYGPEVIVADTAAPGDRLVALLGRQPNW